MLSIIKLFHQKELVEFEEVDIQLSKLSKSFVKVMKLKFVQLFFACDRMYFRLMHTKLYLTAVRRHCTDWYEI